MARGLARVVQWQDVRVLEPSSVTNLLQETLDADSTHRLRRDHFDGNEPAVFNVTGQIDGPHTSVAEFLFEQVSIGQRALEVSLCATL
jgi:hypothetical protein